MVPLQGRKSRGVCCRPVGRKFASGSFQTALTSFTRLIARSSAGSGFRPRRSNEQKEQIVGAVHDMGGQPRSETDRPCRARPDGLGALRTNGLVGVLREKSIINTDELRRGNRVDTAARIRRPHILRAMVGVARGPAGGEGNPYGKGDRRPGRSDEGQVGLKWRGTFPGDEIRVLPGLRQHPPQDAHLHQRQVWASAGIVRDIP